MHTVNPATGEFLREHREHDDSEVDRRLSQAAERASRWRRSTFAERGALLHSVADRLAATREACARQMTEEMGKPITQSLAEVEKCAWVCRHFADHAERDLADESVATDGSHSRVRFEPLGVLLAVMPWNFPFWQVFRAAAPALMAGNVVVLKHASVVPACALAIEELFDGCGAPPGLFTTLLVSSDRAESLIERPEIQAVTLTGSEGAGAAVARRAGAALKKSVLELGGSDAFVVLDDAQLDLAAEQAVAARIISNGQSCIAAKRFIVDERVAEPFERAFTEHMARVRMGDPFDPATELGPLARGDLRDSLQVLVDESVERGALIRTGGTPAPGRGYFYPATVLGDVKPGMPVFDEETFGPVGAVTRARDAAHAIELANRSRFGLGASVWTRDPRRTEELVRELEVGMVFVNGMVKSDPRLPFGGIKRSGYGRELSTAGIREFVNLKTVWVR